MTNLKTTRIKYIDVVRCIGIFLIYVSHFCDTAGFIYPFAYTHHVPLFFIVAGCMENLNTNRGILSTIGKTLKNILIPWLFYSIISIIINVILYNNYENVILYLIQLAKGTVRNQFFASAFWFLTCIAAVRIVFSIIRKLKSKILILSVSLFMFYIAEYALPYRPFTEPSMPYNIDNMLFYMIFYAIGYIAFPYMHKALNPRTSVGKCLLGLSSLVSGFYTALLFLERNLLSYLPESNLTDSIQILICPLIVTWFYCTIAKQFENVPVLNTIGQNTLHLCGNEYIIKTMFPAFLSVFGLTSYVGNPLYLYVYNAVLLIVAVYFLIPYEKKVLEKIIKIFRFQKMGQ